MEWRIGVHLGDVLVEGDDILGDGVNIAARLEGIAEPGGICISEDAFRQVRGKIEAEFADIGEQSLKNIARPLRVYRIGPSLTTEQPTTPPTTLPLPDKPSIAVLPFTNMSGDPEQEYFADGMVEEIITALSRIRWLFVIARNSSFTYKGQAVDVKQVGRELGVRYVLEGSVRKGGNRVRITAQLIDATSGAHLWADRFDGSLEEVFELQDKVAISVAGVIEPTLRQSEIERARRKRPDSLDAYDLYLRALPYAFVAMPDLLGELGSDLVAEKGGDVFGFDGQDGLPGKLFIEGFENGWRAEHQIGGVLDLHETPVVGLGEDVEHRTALLGIVIEDTMQVVG